MSSKLPSRVVFVGNIPYGLSEEQISDIFSGAGKVLNFRLVYDRETGRPKGFGFAEYPDADSAASAVRNLNDYEIMGRKLRVDFSNEGGGDANDDNANSAPSGHNNPYGHAANGTAYQQSSAPLPELPPGKLLPPGVTCTDAISRTLNTLPPPQLLDILASMKGLAVNEPGRATELLTQAPQLSYAIFQALLLMGLVSPEAINSVMQADGAPAAPPPPAAAAPAPIYHHQPYANLSPVGAPYAPPAAAAPTAAPAAAGVVAPDNLMQMLVDMPLETINQLAEPERSQVLALRAQYAGQR